MELFELIPDDSFDRTDIRGEHQWGLPGVKCEVCGATWGSIGVAYPTADLSSLPNAKRYTEFWPVPWNEFEQLRQAVLPLLPPNAIVPPGTNLGPLVGKARGVFPEVAWHEPWTMLLRSDAFARLRERGIRLIGAVARLKGRKELPELVELELLPLGRMTAELRVPPCAVCGRGGGKRGAPAIVERESVPTDYDIFRLGDWTTKILATDRALEAMTALSLRGFRFQSLTLSP